MNWLVPIDVGVSSGLILAWSVLALAIAYRLFDFPDITVEGSFALGAAVYASGTRAGWPCTSTVPLACLAGASCGLLTAFIHVRFGVNKFLAAILVVAMSYSGCLRVMGSSNISLLTQDTVLTWVQGLDQGATYLHGATLASLTLLTVLGVVLILAGLRTRSGLKIRASGSSPDFARGLGLRPGAWLMLGLAITNGLSAVSGVLLSSHQGFADIGMGQGVLILALASMAIGERLTRSSRLALPVFVVCAAVLGSIAYQTLFAIAVRCGLPAIDLKLATAALVLLVIATSRSGLDAKRGEVTA